MCAGMRGSQLCAMLSRGFGGQRLRPPSKKLPLLSNGCPSKVLSSVTLKNLSHFENIFGLRPISFVCWYRAFCLSLRRAQGRLGKTALSGRRESGCNFSLRTLCARTTANGAHGGSRRVPPRTFSVRTGKGDATYVANTRAGAFFCCVVGIVCLLTKNVISTQPGATRR